MDPIKLKNPLLVTDNIINDLNLYKNSVLFSDKILRFIIIKDFKIEDKIVIKQSWKWFKRNTSQKTEHFITEATILINDPKTKAWGLIKEDLLKYIFYYNNIAQMRYSYMSMIKIPLESLGVNFNIRKIDE